MSLSCSSCLRFLRVPALHLPLKVRGPGKWRQLVPQAHLRASFEDSSSLLSEMSKRFKTTKTHVRNLQMSTAQLLAGIPRGREWTGNAVASRISITECCVADFVAICAVWERG